MHIMSSILLTTRSVAIYTMDRIPNLVNFLQKPTWASHKNLVLTLYSLPIIIFYRPEKIFHAFTRCKTMLYYEKGICMKDTKIQWPPRIRGRHEPEAVSAFQGAGLFHG